MLLDTMELMVSLMLTTEVEFLMQVDGDMY